MSIEEEKLRNVIQRFKEYDKERTIQYKYCLSELGKLRSFVQELEDTKSLPKKIINQRKEINRLNTIIKTNNLKELSFEDESIILLRENVRVLKEENKRLKHELLNSRKSISELVYKLYHVSNK